MQQEQPSVISDMLDNHLETQREIFEMEARKTRNRLLILAIVVFAFNMIGLGMIDAIYTETVLSAAIIPALFIGLAFLALKEPLLAMILAALIMVAVWVLNFIQVGAASLLSGWLAKAVDIYLLLSGFQNAREAQKAKKEMKR